MAFLHGSDQLEPRGFPFGLYPSPGATPGWLCIHSSNTQEFECRCGKHFAWLSEAGSSPKKSGPAPLKTLPAPEPGDTSELYQQRAR
jgi:hypothetical protein